MHIHAQYLSITYLDKKIKFKIFTRNKHLLEISKKL